MPNIPLFKIINFPIFVLCDSKSLGFGFSQANN